jgi:hypothetical protein
MNLMQKEKDEESAREYELSQMNDDILYHINATTDQIIAAFKNADSSNDEDCFNTTPIREPRSDW